MPGPTRKPLSSVDDAPKPSFGDILRRKWERFLAGSTPSNDPLYLTNRTWKQKIGLILVISIPVAAMLALVGYALYTPQRAGDKPPAQLSPAEVAARTAIIPKDFTVPQNTDLQVMEASVQKSSGSCYVVGILKNNTGRAYSSAEVIFDLTDEQGSQIGGTSGRSPAVAAHGTVSFRLPIPQDNAAFVLVREIRGTL